MISLPSQKPRIEKEGENKATFIIEGLYPGYGITLGNSLRRVILSSLGGAAIQRVKIEGMPHEFSTLAGVKEDGIKILLSLKGVRFKIQGDKPMKATLKIKGEKEVTAGDFDLPSQLELVNPKHHIATLTDKKAELEMEILVGKGIGYEPVERREEDSSSEVGVIELDSIYLPIKKVSFKVEEMRVGKRTDFDRLMLTIETDGRMEPEQAFDQACQLLIDHFLFSLEGFQLIAKKPENAKKPAKVKKVAKAKKVAKTKKAVKTKVASDKKDISSMQVEELGIPSRIAGILIENKIKSIAGLITRSEESIAKMEGIGPKSVKDIKARLKKLGLELK